MKGSARHLALPLAALAALMSWGAGCAGLPSPDAGRDERALTVAIAVEEVPAEDAWRVWYSLGAPARGVEFLAPAAAFRHERWGVAVARGEASWEAEGGRERLCFSRPAQSFSASFRTWAEGPPGGRALHLAFGGTGRLLYTGHLLVRPLASCGAEAGPPEPAGDPAFRLTFQTTPERVIRVAGRTEAGALRWQPVAPGEGAAATYAFFGELEAVEGEAATLILDPGLPPPLAAELAAAVPRLVERFGAETATPLPSRPLVLVAWNGDADAAPPFSAAALPGVLLATAAGPGWAEEGPEARGGWFDPLARALFQLWAGGVYPTEAESAWLAEAAAGHFAAQAAVALGVEDETEARRRLVERANDCLVRLEGRELLAAAGADSRAGSACGAVALAAADGALRRGDPPSGLAALFRRLFEHAAATGGFGTAAFFGGLRELGAEPGAVGDVRRLIRGGAARGDLFLQTLLEHAGVATEPVPPGEATADPETLREAVRRAVGRCYCGTGEAASCEPAATGRELGAVAGEPVSADPLAAWERLRSAVARGGAIEVELAGEEVTLFCPQDTFDPTWDSLLRLAGPGTQGA